MTAPTPEWFEAQRRAAPAACAAMRTALRCGQVGTAQTKLMLVEVYLRALEKEKVNV